MLWTLRGDADRGLRGGAAGGVSRWTVLSLDGSHAAPRGVGEAATVAVGLGYPGSRLGRLCEVLRGWPQPSEAMLS